MGAMMIFLMTLVITFVNFGLSDTFLLSWAKAFAIAYVAHFRRDGHERCRVRSNVRRPRRATQPGKESAFLSIYCAGYTHS